MVTLQYLKDTAPDTIFATGIVTDNSTGINMSGSGQELRRVAVRGGIHDWAIYIHLAQHPAEWVRDHGDKVHNRENVKRLVRCDDEALEMYRD